MHVQLNTSNAFNVLFQHPYYCMLLFCCFLLTFSFNFCSSSCIILGVIQFFKNYWPRLLMSFLNQNISLIWFLTKNITIKIGVVSDRDPDVEANLHNWLFLDNAPWKTPVQFYILKSKLLRMIKKSLKCSTSHDVNCIDEETYAVMYISKERHRDKTIPFILALSNSPWLKKTWM